MHSKINKINRNTQAWKKFCPQNRAVLLRFRNGIEHRESILLQVNESFYGIWDVQKRVGVRNLSFTFVGGGVFDGTGQLSFRVARTYKGASSVGPTLAERQNLTEEDRASPAKRAGIRERRQVRIDHKK